MILRLPFFKYLKNIRYTGIFLNLINNEFHTCKDKYISFNIYKKIKLKIF